MKELEKKRMVYDLCQENEGLREFLADNGFSPLANDLMFNTSARLAPLETGLTNHKIDLAELNEKLAKLGLKVV